MNKKGNLKNRDQRVPENYFSNPGGPVTEAKGKGLRSRENR